MNRKVKVRKSININQYWRKKKKKMNEDYFVLIKLGKSRKNFQPTASNHLSFPPTPAYPFLPDPQKNVSVFFPSGFLLRTVMIFLDLFTNMLTFAVVPFCRLVMTKIVYVSFVKFMFIFFKIGFVNLLRTFFWQN